LTPMDIGSRLTIRAEREAGCPRPTMAVAARISGHGDAC
jgi:hypothetical protein